MTSDQRSRYCECQIDAAQEPAELPSRGNIKRDESHYSFVLNQLGVNKMCGFMSGRESTAEWRQGMFQQFNKKNKTLHRNHKMLFIGVTDEDV